MTWSPRGPRALREGDAPARLEAWAPEELVEAVFPAFDEAPVAVPAGAAPAAGDAPEIDGAALEQALQDEYDRGFADGHRAAAQAEAARLRGAVTALEEALAIVQAEGGRWVGTAQDNISALAIAVARQLLDRELQLDKSSLARLVQQALVEFPMDQALTIRVNPADLQAIQAAFQALGEESPLQGRKDVQWLPDARLASGGCQVEGRERILDGRIDTALERLYRRLSAVDA